MDSISWDGSTASSGTIQIIESARQLKFDIGEARSAFTAQANELSQKKTIRAFVLNNSLRN